MSLTLIKLIGEIIVRILSLLNKLNDRRTLEAERDLRRLKRLKPGGGLISDYVDSETITYDEEEDMAGSNNTGTVIMAFITGGVVGVALGVLFAPKSGKETREDIARAVEDVKVKTDELTQEAKTKIEGFVEEAKDKFAGDETEEAPETEEA
ncbi:MAG: YtxH domain-containing protein [bacterium]|nr:YtxH domain-containing protein [bacterium]